MPGGPITIADGDAAIREFFRRMSACCAAQDYDATEVLFATDVVSFGTKAVVVEGLVALRRDQWEHIWPTIKGFAMQLEQVHSSSQADLAWGMVPWTSTGFDQSGAPFERPGRATAILERRSGTWLCVHTHFSLAPRT